MFNSSVTLSMPNGTRSERRCGQASESSGNAKNRWFSCACVVKQNQLRMPSAAASARLARRVQYSQQVKSIIAATSPAPMVR